MNKADCALQSQYSERDSYEVKEHWTNAVLCLMLRFTFSFYIYDKNRAQL